ncbi:hypothetical protein BHECKSOX2_139 [Bathymodiolus heckerae thiotrophic gill symbiont]|uniref:type II toxin-antitoxin system RelE/ParE family toxin n=1 Tax=Bathymodiolus heckerae thiotrophic gill symbiont TaxID=1052212 RepID=UPI0010B8ABAC|nr:type II toxin-antitoxin system RelE/ParE family toxin [Bathymodiolus heckerae thiotrophic gill symbiont]SMN13156.1 hypothetical protein BHECKSOX2_139 [Bathymodiolus heckerae thiotrophic gill symbiont]
MGDIVDYIALDSVQNALKFYQDLLVDIDKIAGNPHQHRRSLPHQDDAVRELVFKDYIIIFNIRKSSNKIIILGIFSQNLWNKK